MSVDTVVAVPVLALMGAFFIRQLRAAGYSFADSGLISIISLAQAGLITNLLDGVQAILFAAVIFALMASAISLVREREDVRAVIALGGSLGAIQIVDPAGGAIAALALPMLVGLQRKRLSQQWGLLVILLFIPVMVAAVLAFAANYFPAFDPSPFAVSADESFIAPSHILLRQSLASLVFFIPGILPVAWALSLRSGRTREMTALCVVALAVVLAAVAAVYFGAVRDPTLFLGALSSVPVLVIVQARSQKSLALTVCAVSTCLSWIVAFAVPAILA